MKNLKMYLGAPKVKNTVTGFAYSCAKTIADILASVWWYPRIVLLAPHSAISSKDRYANYFVTTPNPPWTLWFWYRAKNWVCSAVAPYEILWSNYGKHPVSATLVQNKPSIALLPVIWSINLYARYISPFFPAHCRFYPCCSSYALSVIKSRGWRGIGWAIYRLMRCHPWHPGGVDLPPDK